MSGERYWLHTPQGRVPLPQSMRPDVFLPMTITPNLVRARGYRAVFDLSDGLPDPEAWVMKGEVFAESEAHLSLLVKDLRRQVRAATAIDRDERRTWAIQGAYLQATTVSGDSRRGLLTLTLVLEQVPDPDDESEYDF